MASGNIASNDIDVEKKLSIHPNPTNSLINIYVNDTISIQSVSIYNSIGTLVFETSSNLKKINIENFTHGVYLLKIDTNEGSIVKKIIKK